jgi:hypothetical protein
MEDKRKNNGGHKSAGRKSKAEEQSLIEKLSPLEPLAFDALKTALEDKKDWAVKLTFEYLFGKPKQTIDQNTSITSNEVDWVKFFGGNK